MKSTAQYAKEIKDKWNLTLTSEYTGAHKVVTFNCENGHSNETAATNLLQRGYRCKQCLHGRQIESKLEWTDANILKLQDLLDRGIPTIDIAKSLNTTESAIHNAVAKFSIIRGRHTHRKEELLSILKEQERTLLSEFSSIKGQVRVRCKNGHEVMQDASNILQHHSGCNKCTKIEPSKVEKELREFIESIYKGWIIYNDRSILEGKELDIVLPDKSLAFEFNGNYWHSNIKVPKSYHKDKSDKCEEEGFQLIHIYEHVWNNKKDIIKDKIRSLIVPQSRLGARKTIIKEITWQEAKEFLTKTHIQGAGQPTKYNYALYYNGNIVSLATFNTPRFTNKYEMELVRFSSSTPVQGALSKLTKHAQKQLNFKSLISYALRDYSQGKAYLKAGFTLSHITDPNYVYVNRTQVVSRYKAQKHLLPKLLEVFDPKLSEEENMRNNGYYKLYDSGNLVFFQQFL